MISTSDSGSGIRTSLNHLGESLAALEKIISQWCHYKALILTILHASSIFLQDLLKARSTMGPR